MLLTGWAPVFESKTPIHGTRRQSASRFEHSQATDRGANSVGDCDFRSFSASQVLEERLDLLAVTLPRKPERTVALGFSLHAQAFEVFGHGSQSRSKNFNTFST